MNCDLSSPPDDPLLFTCSRCGGRFRLAVQPSSSGINKQCAVRGPDDPPDERYVTLEDRPCVHRGELLRVEKCQLCGAKDVPMPIHACAVHGECALRRWWDDKKISMGTCSGCDQRSPPPPIDDQPERVDGNL